MPTHWSVTDNAPACNRSQTHWRTVTCPAAEYLTAQQSDPMKYCSRCAKLCKLSMQGSQALRSVETRTDSDRYSELRAAQLALAAESAPKPLDAVWPKPRPISEAPKDGSMMLICLPNSKPQWTMGVFDRTHWVDLCLATAIVDPTHFLPLPPEVM